MSRASLKRGGTAMIAAALAFTAGVWVGASRTTPAGATTLTAVTLKSQLSFRHRKPLRIALRYSNNQAFVNIKKVQAKFQKAGATTSVAWTNKGSPEFSNSKKSVVVTFCPETAQATAPPVGTTSKVFGTGSLTITITDTRPDPITGMPVDTDFITTMPAAEIDTDPCDTFMSTPCPPPPMP
jgi:hypothetical protein